jgi:hypothetical protein
MTTTETRSPRGRSLSTRFAVALLATTAIGGSLAYADDDDFFFFRPGDLLLSKAVYDAPTSAIAPGATLPPGCTSATAAASATPCVAAINDGTYPTVFNNDTVDASFGITTKIVLDELRPDNDGDLVNSLEVPNSSQRHVTTSSDQMVTSFSSKSEIALNLSLDHKRVTFMGYLAPIGAIDVSNSNTPFVVDPTNPVPGTDYRVIASVDAFGHFTFTKTNAYSGNNGRSVVLNNVNGANVYYMTGNAGNGANPQPTGIVVGAGAQIATPSKMPLSQQADPGLPTPVGSFNTTEVGNKADKVGKDTNFRGLRVFHDVIYATKGSGSNGVNTVYFIDTSGTTATSTNPTGNPKACPNGSGVPVAGATLPTTPIVYSTAVLAADGVTPYNMCVLAGFPTSPAKNATDASLYPFGVWFANDTTLYVADEGAGDAAYNATSNTFTAAAASTTAGLQKWVLNTTTNTWSLAYTLQAGLNLGVPYTVKGYPTGINPVTITSKVPAGLPWSPATDGLRNLTGRVNHDGTVTIWAITSTVSGNGDQGADPNKLVMITDKLSATTLPANESFKTVRTAAYGEALRGISFTPGTEHDRDDRHAFGGELGNILCLFDRDDCRH